MLHSYKEVIRSLQLSKQFKNARYLYSGEKQLRDAKLMGGRVWEESKPEVLLSLFKAIKQPEDTTYISLGSGIGTDCIVAAACGYKRIIGYELEPFLITLAQKIISRIEKKQAILLPIEFRNETLFNAPVEESDLAYLFHDNNFTLGPAFTTAFGERWKKGSHFLYNTVRNEDDELRGKFLASHLKIKTNYTINNWRTYHLELFEF